MSKTVDGLKINHDWSDDTYPRIGHSDSRKSRSAKECAVIYDVYVDARREENCPLQPVRPEFFAMSCPRSDYTVVHTLLYSPFPKPSL